MLLASTKRGQSDGSAIPMGPPISRGGSPPTSAPTTGVTTSPGTTTATPLPTIGNAPATAAGRGRSRSLARLAQNEELECVSREARSRRRLGEGALEMSVAPNSPPTMIDASRQATRLMVQQRGSKILRRIAGAEDTNDARSVRGNDADER